MLTDATWTPRGNIVYTTTPSNKVVVITESGKIITTHSQMSSPRYLSISHDDIMYLTDENTGVYQSTDDGVSWNLVFKPTEGLYCKYIIRVMTAYGDGFWSLERRGFYKYHLRVYKIRSDGNLTWTDISVPTAIGKHCDLCYSSLSYDGNKNIFLGDHCNKAVHVFSVNGHYNCQLLPSHHIENRPRRLALDKERQQLFLGQEESVVEVFKLTYGDGGG